MNATRAQFSFVREVPPVSPEEASRHFQGRLSFETDPADLHLDLERGADKMVVIDARSAQQFRECHIPGAISLPHRSINEAAVAGLSPDATLVTYCWGPGCNSATKAAARLSALGFHVKEMIGGIEYWRREGYAVVGTLGDAAPLTG